MPVAGDDSREFPDVERDYLRRRGWPDFDWVRFGERSPRHRPRRKLSQARIGLLSTAGAHLPGEPPIPPSGPPHVIPIEADVALTHPGYDTRRSAGDPEVVWPVRTLQRLAQQGFIGTVSGRAVSMMGAVMDGRLVFERHVPAAVDQFRRDRVDLVLLVPA
jgi:hypothetical protein